MQSFFNLVNITEPPFDVPDISAVDAFMNGFANDTSERFDAYFARTLREELFAGGHNMSGLDLVALNIQRGREHGLRGKRRRERGCGGDVTDVYFFCIKSFEVCVCVYAGVLVRHNDTIMIVVEYLLYSIGGINVEVNCLSRDQVTVTCCELVACAWMTSFCGQTYATNCSTSTAPAATARKRRRTYEPPTSVCSDNL